MTGVREDYEHFLPVAKKVDAARVQTFRGDAAVAYFNVLPGLEAVLAARPALDARGVPVDWNALQELPRIALGLVYACEQVDATATPRASSPQTRAAARVLLDIGLSGAETLAKAGHLKSEDVKKLRKKCDARDPGPALTNVADFYRKHEATVRGRCPFGPEQVAEAERIATELIKTTRRKGTKLPVDKALATARTCRNQLAALLIERYEALECAAGARWGRSLGEHVPSLFSRVIQRKKKPPTS